MFPFNVSNTGDIDVTKINVGDGIIVTTDDKKVGFGNNGIYNGSTVQIGFGENQNLNSSVTPLSIYALESYPPGIEYGGSSIQSFYNVDTDPQDASGITFSGRTFGNVTIPRARVGAHPQKFSIDALRPVNEDFIVEYQQNAFEGGFNIPKGSPAVVRYISFETDLSAIYFNQDLFVAMSRTGNTIQTYLSSDGVNWTDRRTIEGTFEWSSLTFGLGLYVSVSNIIATSPDGTIWTQRTAPDVNYTGITFGNGIFVAVGDGTIVYSTTGSIWISLEISEVLSERHYTGIAFGNNRFVAVSKDGISYSDNGINWIVSTSTTVNYSGVTFGNDQYVAVREDGLIERSFDGITWSLSSSVPNITLQYTNVKFGNSLFVATAKNGVAISIDGDVWELKYLSTTQSWNDVAFGKNRFIVVGDNSRILKFITNIKTSIRLFSDSIISGDIDRLHLDVITGDADTAVYDVVQISSMGESGTEIILTHPTKEIKGRASGGAYINRVHKYSRPSSSSVYTVKLNRLGNEFSTLSVNDFVNMVFIDLFDSSAVSSTFSVITSDSISGTFTVLGSFNVQSATDADCLVFKVSYQSRFVMTNEGRVGINLSPEKYGFGVLGSVGVYQGIFNKSYYSLVNQEHRASGDIVPAEDGRPIDIFNPVDNQVGSWSYTLENKVSGVGDFKVRLGTPFSVSLIGTSRDRLGFYPNFVRSTPQDLTEFVVSYINDQKDPFGATVNVPAVEFVPGVYEYEINIFNPSVDFPASMSIFDERDGRVRIWPSFTFENFEEISVVPSSPTGVIGIVPPNTSSVFRGLMRIDEQDIYRFAYSNSIYQDNNRISTFDCFFTPITTSLNPATFTSVSYDVDNNVISSGSIVLSTSPSSGLYREGDVLETGSRISINDLEEGVVSKFSQDGIFKWATFFSSPDGNVIVTSTTSKINDDIYVVASTTSPSNTLVVKTFTIFPNNSRTYIIRLDGETGSYLGHVSANTSDTLLPIYPMGMDTSHDDRVSFALACRDRISIFNSSGQAISKFVPDGSEGEYTYEEPVVEDTSITVRYDGITSDSNRFVIDPNLSSNVIIQPTSGVDRFLITANRWNIEGTIVTTDGVSESFVYSDSYTYNNTFRSITSTNPFPFAPEMFQRFFYNINGGTIGISRTSGSSLRLVSGVPVGADYYICSGTYQPLISDPDIIQFRSYNQSIPDSFDGIEIGKLMVMTFTSLTNLTYRYMRIANVSEINTDLNFITVQPGDDVEYITYARYNLLDTVGVVDINRDISFNNVYLKFFPLTGNFQYQGKYTRTIGNVFAKDTPVVSPEETPPPPGRLDFSIVGNYSVQQGSQNVITVDITNGSLPVGIILDQLYLKVFTGLAVSQVYSATLVNQNRISLSFPGTTAVTSGTCALSRVHLYQRLNNDEHIFMINKLRQSDYDDLDLHNIEIENRLFNTAVPNQLPVASIKHEIEGAVETGISYNTIGSTIILNKNLRVNEKIWIEYEQGIRQLVTILSSSDNISVIQDGSPPSSTGSVLIHNTYNSVSGNVTINFPDINVLETSSIENCTFSIENEVVTVNSPINIGVSMGSIIRISGSVALDGEYTVLSAIDRQLTFEKPDAVNSSGVLTLILPSNYTINNNTLTATTRTEHGLRQGMTIQISNISGDLPSGEYVVGSILTNKSFSISLPEEYDTSGAFDINFPSHIYVAPDSIGLKFSNGRTGGFSVVSVSYTTITVSVPGLENVTNGLVELASSYTSDSASGDVVINYIQRDISDGEYVFLIFPELGIIERQVFRDIDLNNFSWTPNGLKSHRNITGYVKILRYGYSKIGEKQLVKVPNHKFRFFEQNKGFRLYSSSTFYNNDITIQFTTSSSATFTDPKLIVDGTGLLDILPAFTDISPQVKRFDVAGHGLSPGDNVAVMGADERAVVRQISNIQTDTFDVDFLGGYNPTEPRIISLFDSSSNTVTIRLKSHGYNSGQLVGLLFPVNDTDNSNVQFTSEYTITGNTLDTFSIVISNITDQSNSPVYVTQAYSRSGTSITVTHPNHGYSNGDQVPIFIQGNVVIADLFSISSSTPSQYTLSNLRFSSIPTSGILRSVFKYSSVGQSVTFLPRRNLDISQRIARWYITMPSNFQSYSIDRVFNTIYTEFIDESDAPVRPPTIFRVMDIINNNNDELEVRAASLFDSILVHRQPTFTNKNCITYPIDQSQAYDQPIQSPTTFDTLPPSGILVVSRISSYDRFSDGSYQITDIGAEFEAGERVFVEFIDSADIDAVSGIFTITLSVNGTITIQSSVTDKPFSSGDVVVNPYITLPPLPIGSAPDNSGECSISPLVSYRVSSSGVYTFFESSLRFTSGDDVFMRFADAGRPSGIFILSNVTQTSFSVTSSGTQTGAERRYAFIEKLILPENNGEPFIPEGQTTISQVVNYNTSAFPPTITVSFPFSPFSSGDNIVVRFYDTPVIVESTAVTSSLNSLTFLLESPPNGYIPESNVRKLIINRSGDNVFELRNMTTNTLIRSYIIPKNTTFSIPPSRFVVPLESQLLLLNTSGIYSSQTNVTSATFTLIPEDLFVSQNQLRIALFKLDNMLSQCVGEAALTSGTISPLNLGFIDQGLSAFRIKEGVIRHDTRSSSSVLYLTLPIYLGVRFYYFDIGGVFTNIFLKNFRGSVLMGLKGSFGLSDITLMSILSQASLLSGSVITTSIDVDRGMFGNSENPNIYVCGTCVGSVNIRGTVRIGNIFVDTDINGSQTSERQGAFLCKFNSLGLLQWFSLVDGSDVEQAVSIAVDDVDPQNFSGLVNVYILGSFNSEITNIYESRKGTLNPADTTIIPVKTLRKTIPDRNNVLQRESFILKFNQNGQHLLTFRSSSTGLISPVYLEVGPGDNVISCLKVSATNITLGEPDGRVSKYLSRPSRYDFGVLIKYRTTNSLVLKPIESFQTTDVIKKKIINKSKFSLYVAAYSNSSGIDMFLTDVFVVPSSTQLPISNNGDVWYSGASDTLTSDFLFLDKDNAKFGFGTESPTSTFDLKGDIFIEGLMTAGSLDASQNVFIKRDISVLPSTQPSSVNVYSSVLNNYSITWFPKRFTQGFYDDITTDNNFIILDGFIVDSREVLLSRFTDQSFAQNLIDLADRKYNIIDDLDIQFISVKKGIYKFELFVTNDSFQFTTIDVTKKTNNGSVKLATLAEVNLTWNSPGSYSGVVPIIEDSDIRIELSNNAYLFSSRVALKLESDKIDYPYRINNQPIFPRGMVMMWNNPSKIPFGWVPCDGRVVDGFKIPDLRGRFILGYSSTSGNVGNGPVSIFNPTGDQYFANRFNIGDVSGQNIVVIESNHLPRHRHRIPYRDQDGSDANANNNYNNSSNVIQGYNEFSGQSGGMSSVTKGHNNTPPFYTLIYICKI